MTNFLENKHQLKSLLSTLNQGITPNFGLMTPQHMVEHLSYSIRFSNGKKPQKLTVKPTLAKKIKHYLFEKDDEIQPGFKSPLLPKDQLIDLSYTNLETAIHKLLAEMEEYQTFKIKNPDATPINPVIGPLNWAEWDIFHNKHIRHHLRQFLLIE